MSSIFCSRRLVLTLSLLAAFLLAPPLVQAQTAQSVVEQTRDKMLDMYSGVDHFMVRTNMHTSYTRVVTKNGEKQIETQMGSMRGDGSGAPMGGSTVNALEQMDALAQHATYQGTRNVSGVECHVLFLEDPSKMDANLQGADEVSYYISTADNLIHGMDMTMSDGTGMQMRMVDYQNYNGIMYPSRMEMAMVQNSEEQKQKMKELEEQLKQMPEGMRERMKKQMEQAMNMMSGEPMVVETKEVVVNGPLPDGIFNN